MLTFHPDTVCVDPVGRLSKSRLLFPPFSRECFTLGRVSLILAFTKCKRTTCNHFSVSNQERLGRPTKKNQTTRPGFDLTIREENIGLGHYSPLDCHSCHPHVTSFCPLPREHLIDTLTIVELPTNNCGRLRHSPQKVLQFHPPSSLLLHCTARHRSFLPPSGHA